MSSGFTIDLDQLHKGKRETIKGDFDPTFLGTNEKELQFPLPIHVEGEAYLAEEELVLHLKANTLAKMPCTICNEMWGVEVKVNSFYHTQPVQELKEPQFDWREILREAVLTELPHYVECHGGKCPERPFVASYLKKSPDIGKSTHNPFAGLES